MKIKKYIQPALNTLIILLITFSLLEVIFLMFLKFPQLNNVFPYIKQYVRGYYMGRDRNIVQFMPECAQYDDGLTYTLREGECVVTNREFSVKYKVNKKGLRDDEESLKRPDVIVLGDSHAMGWGVDQDKTFPSLVEKDSGLKVLNAAISSYGTAREFLMLKRLDRRNLKYLIIQHCTNDVKENAQFVANSYDLKITSKEEYEKIVQKHVNRVKYKPFRFSALIIRNIVRIIRGKEDDEVKLKEKEKEFVNLVKIVERMRRLVGSDVKIILMEVEGNNDNREYFAKEVKKVVQKFPRLKKQLVVIDSSKIVTDQDYFTLDDHMKNDGHRKIADEVLQVIEKR